MGKKKKKRVQLKTSPLSFLDKLVYAVGYILLIVIFVAGIVGFGAGQYKTAFSDAAVLASDSGLSIILAVFILLLAVMVPLVCWYEINRKRLPLFGDKDIEYGKSPWKKVYPVFSKKGKKNIAVLCIFLIFEIAAIITLAAVAPSILADRNATVTEDGSIHKYDAENRETAVYYKENISDCDIFVEHRTARIGLYWEYGITLTVDGGEEFTFNSDDFKNGFETMLKIKEA